eukprot:g5078.t1
MGCAHRKPGRQYEQAASAAGDGAGVELAERTPRDAEVESPWWKQTQNLQPRSSSSQPQRIAPPRPEDILTHVSFLDETGDSCVVSGVNGGCYVYDLKSGKPDYVKSFSVGSRACTKVYPFPSVASNLAGLQSGKSSSSSSATKGGNRRKGPAFLTCGGDGLVKLWDCKLNETTVASHRMTVSAAAFDAEHQRVLTGSRDCVLNLTDIETKKPLQQQKILRNVVTELVYVPARDVFVQLSEDLQIRVWSKHLELLQKNIAGGPNQLISGCVIGGGRGQGPGQAGDGQTVVCGSKGFSKETVELVAFDLRTMTIRKRKQGVATQNLDCLAGRWWGGTPASRDEDAAEDAAEPVVGDDPDSSNGRTNSIMGRNTNESAAGGKDKVETTGSLAATSDEDGHREMLSNSCSFVAGSKDGSLRGYDCELNVVKEFKLPSPAPVTACAMSPNCVLATSFGPQMTAFDLDSQAVVLRSG